MEGKDNIKELFSQKLGNYEANVNPELWAKISSQVAAGATTTVATGVSLFTKIVIGVGVSAAAIATVVVINSTNAPIENEEPKTDVSNEALPIEPSKKSPEGAPTNQQVNSNTNNNSGTQRQTTPLSSNSVTAATTDRPDYSEVGRLKPKGTLGIETSTKEPIRVQGITYAGMTNYGTPPTSFPEDLDQAAKSQPIEKYTNVFSPNGDGANDQFNLVSKGLTDFSIVIFDPKGDIVFKSSDPAFLWDGSDIRTGELVPAGRYMYMVSAYDSEGNPFPIYEQLMIQY